MDKVESFWWRGFSEMDNGPYDYSSTPENYVAPSARAQHAEATDDVTASYGAAATQSTPGATAEWRPASTLRRRERQPRCADAESAAATSALAAALDAAAGGADATSAGYALTIAIALGCVALGYDAGTRHEQHAWQGGYELMIVFSKGSI